MNERRLHALSAGEPGQGPVLYWMHREHRARDNWGLLHAQGVALRAGRPLAVVYGLADTFLGATMRQFGFLLDGLRLVEAELSALNIPFFLLRGDPPEEIARFAGHHGAHTVVTDFDSLRLKRQWLARAAKALACPLVEADSRNVCPCRAVSDKREYMARTIRPKIMRLLPEFLEPFPALAPHPVPWPGHGPANDFLAARAALAVDRSVAEVDWARPGTDAGMKMLRAFTAERLPRYHERNDPNAGAVSLLSPWLHFGMISAQRVALEALRATAPAEARDSFVEELVVRRELADNFCLHAPDYDSVSCFPDWAARSLDKHRGDERPWLYGLDDLEGAATHDPLWNAAQRQMVRRGHMHGWLRMYWAKKILEWSATPEEALRAAIFLNDRYQLDGREANGYAGIAWALGGVHDRPWAERPVFGSVRYMNFAGARRKFDVAAFVSAFGDARDRELLTAMR